jgi:hypothetical protein
VGASPEGVAAAWTERGCIRLHTLAMVSKVIQSQARTSTQLVAAWLPRPASSCLRMVCPFWPYTSLCIGQKAAKLENQAVTALRIK